MSDEKPQTEDEKAGLPEGTLASVRAAHPGVPISVIRTDAGTFVIKVADTADFECWLDLEGQDKRRQTKAMARKCIVYPEREAVDELLGKFPGLIYSLSGDVVDLTMGGIADKRKKL